MHKISFIDLVPHGNSYLYNIFNFMRVLLRNFEEKFIMILLVQNISLYSTKTNVEYLSIMDDKYLNHNKCLWKVTETVIRFPNEVKRDKRDIIHKEKGIN